MVVVLDYYSKEGLKTRCQGCVVSQSQSNEQFRPATKASVSYTFYNKAFYHRF